MPDFRYEVINIKGRSEKGKLAANSKLEALQILSSRGYIVSSIKQSSSSRSTTKASMFPASQKEVSIFSRQLATMVSSGVRIREALQVLSTQVLFSRRFRKIIARVVLDIEGGMSFSESLERSGVFEPLFTNLVKAGEAGGVLDESLERVADFYEGMVELQNQVKSAMAYPLFMMVFAVGIVGMISFFILPNLISAFGGNFEPEGTMAILLKMNDILKNQWPLLLVLLFGLLIGGFFFFKSKYGNIVKENIGKLIPPVRTLRNMTAMERFTRTTAVLVASGVDLPTVLELAGEVSQSPRVMKAVMNAIVSIKGGESISASLEHQKVFPPIVVSMVATGEETGKLDEVMFKVADFYHMQVQNALKKLVSLVEPIMILFIGGFIGFLAITIYSAVFAMEQSIG
ncbi:MAG: type II secretion system F family protein [Kosmotogaceae bacterium]|nr:type II secretion system F family protein [Kosmotogaceae bacterium]